MKRYTLLLIVAVLGLTSCLKKDNETPFVDAKAQLAKDTTTIRKFITDNNIPAIKDASGLFYQIIEPGTGNHNYSASSVVTINYTGRLLNGSVFEKTNGTNYLISNLGQISPTNNGLILGFQIGVPLIQKGGKIRLIIPSGYAYGDRGQGSIPANSILDFDIELIDVK